MTATPLYFSLNRGLSSEINLVVKRCAYCGKENIDEAVRCCECGTDAFKSAEDPVAQAPAQKADPHREQSIPGWLMEKVGILSAEEMQKQFVTVTTCRTLPEADMIVSDLEGAGITAFVPDQFAIQNFSFANTLGYVRVQVAPSDFEAARELLADRGVDEATNSEPGPAAPDGQPLP